MTAMLAPRPALLTFNARDDCCFAADHALPPLLEAAQPVYRLFGREANLRTHVNQDPGTHNYLKDNREAFYRMLGDHFFPDRPDYPAAEIPVDAEVKTPDQLRVALPPDNATLHRLAMDLAAPLPRTPALPAEKAQALAWQVAGRDRLAEVTRARRYAIRAEPAGSEAKEGRKVEYWTLKADDTWSIPAVELSRGEPKGTTLLLHDAGRKEAGPIAEGLLEGGRRVLALDLFDTGESKIPEKAWLWNLYVSAVGDRPLGLQAAQLAAVARWSEATGRGRVAILADGPRSTTAALVAAALEPDAIAALELRGAPATLKEPIEAGTPFEKAPDRFCFGLLESFDIPQLVALAAPRKVQFADQAPRAVAALAPLKAWYATLGVDFSPTP